MASGRTHTRINLVGTSFVVPLIYIYSMIPVEVLVAFGGGSVFGTCFLSPDLDLKQSDSNRAWGGLRVLWHGYHRLCSHRKISHFVLLGTLSRISYLLVLGVLLLFIGMLAYWGSQYQDVRGVLHAQSRTGDLIREATLWVWSNRILVGGFFCGLVFADILHLISDLIYSACRRNGFFSGNVRNVRK